MKQADQPMPRYLIGPLFEYFQGESPTAYFEDLAQSAKYLNFLAGWKGLEPSASGVTGRRYNQLNYHPSKLLVGGTGLEPVTPGL
jgi:hypothetical protein